MEVTEQPVQLKRLPWRPYPRTWRGWASLLLITIVLLLGTAWGLSRATPPWHAPLDPAQEWVQDLNDTAPKKATNLVSWTRLPQQYGDFDMTFTADEINAALAVNVQHVLDSNTTPGAPPPIFSEPVVTFTKGKITISLRSPKIPGGNPKGGVGTAVFTVDVNEANGQRTGLVQLSSVWVGLLPVPRSLVQSRLNALLPAVTSVVQDAGNFQNGTLKAPDALAYVQDLATSAIQGRAFPMEYVGAHDHFVIKELRVEQGFITIVLNRPRR